MGGDGLNWLVVSLAAGVLVLVATWGADRALRRRASAGTRHALWTMTFGILAASPLLAAVLPLRMKLSVPHQVSTALGIAGEGRASGLPHPASASPSDPSAATDSIGPAVFAVSCLAATEGRDFRGTTALDSATVAGGARRFESQAVRVGGEESATWWAHLDKIVVLAWLVGGSTLLLGGGLASIHGCVLRARSRSRPGSRAANLAERVSRELGLRHPVRLGFSEHLAVPVVQGLLRPVLLLPEQAAYWGEDRLRAVFLHELAHLDRNDHLWQALRHLAQALHWPNPLVWFGGRRARGLAERACDDVVLRCGVPPVRYSRHLLDILREARGARIRPGLAAVNATMFKERLRAILDAQTVRSPDGGARRLALPAVVILLLGAGTASVELTGAGGEPSFGRIREAAPDTIAELVERLESSNAEVRRLAALALGDMEPSTTNVVALKRALEDPDPKVRELVVLSLQRLGGPHASRLLSPMVLDPDQDVRSVTAWALGQIGDAAAVAALARLLREDVSAHTRGMAVDALGGSGRPTAVELLLEAVRTEALPSLRAKAIENLAGASDPRIRSLLVDALTRDPSAGVRRAAVHALADGSAPAPLAALEGAALDDAAREVRMAAVEALGRIGTPQALDVLYRALGDQEHEVRITAYWALLSSPRSDRS